MTTSLKTGKVYDDIVEFIATGTTPETVVNFKLSADAQDRLDDLVYRQGTGDLTPDEKQELDYFLVLEHIMRLAKALAHQYIQVE